MFIDMGHISKVAFNKETAEGEPWDVSHPAKPRMGGGCESQTTPSFRGQGLFSILPSSCKTKSRSGFGVGRGPRACPADRAAMASRWDECRHISAAQLPLFYVYLYFSLPFSPPRPPHEAGLLVGCGGRRCETAEACVWAALLWVSLCVSALRALGRADGSGWQRVSV